jgi:NAD(P)-dependent dehydrogenase (short-subunit alcohol dehydrogenase family)
MADVASILTIYRGEQLTKPREKTVGRVDGKVAIVTGGAAGIGRSTAELLAREGAAVMVADLNLSGATEVVEGIVGQTAAFAFDAADASSIEALIAATIARFGRIDILHNNAAMTSQAWARDTTVLDTSLDTWDQTFAVNLRSQFVACKAALPHMLRGGGGSIINMASGSGHKGAAGLVAYGTSKAATMCFTRYVAVQYGRQNVRANCIAPGVILTDQVRLNAPDLAAATLRTLPFSRVGKAEDVANMVLYLASDESAFVNGQTFNCDGGSSAGTASFLKELNQNRHPESRTAG